MGWWFIKEEPKDPTQVIAESPVHKQAGVGVDTRKQLKKPKAPPQKPWDKVDAKRAKKAKTPKTSKTPKQVKMKGESDTKRTITLRQGEGYSSSTGKITPRQTRPVGYAEPYTVNWTLEAYQKHTKRQSERGEEQYKLAVEAGYTGEKLRPYQEYKTASKQAYIESLTIPPYVSIKGTESKQGFQFIEDPVKKAKQEYKGQGVIKQLTRAWFTGVTYTPKYVTDTLISPITKKSQKDIKNEMLMWEATTWGHAKQIHTGGDPLPYIQDVAFSPTMQEVYITAATAGIAKGVPKVGASVVRRGASTYTHVSRFVPEESIIGKGLTKTASKVTGTEVGGNIYKWAVKGYKPGLRLVGEGVRVEPRVTRVFGKQTIEYSKRTIAKGGYQVEKVWMSPERFASEQLKLSKRLGTEYGMGKLNPVYKGGKLAKIEVIGYKTTTKLKGSLKQPFSKQLVSKTESFTWTHTVRPDKAPQTFFKSILPVSGVKKSPYFAKGFGFLPDEQIVKKGVAPDYGGIGITKLKGSAARRPFYYGTPLESGDVIPEGIAGYFYTKEPPMSIVTKGLRPGRVTSYPIYAEVGKGERLAWSKLFPTVSQSKKLTTVGKTIHTPLKTQATLATQAGKKWTTKYWLKHPIKYFYQERTAMQPLISTGKETTKTVVSKTVMGGKLGLIRSAQAPIIPFKIPVGLTTPVIYAGVKFSGGLVPGDKAISKRLTSPTITSRRITAMPSIPLSKALTGQMVDNISLTNIPNIPKIKQTQITEPVVIPQLDQGYLLDIPLPKATIKAKAYSDTTSIPSVYPGMFPVIPSIKVGGRGIGSWNAGLKGSKYRFREFKLPNLERLLK